MRNLHCDAPKNADNSIHVSAVCAGALTLLGTRVGAHHSMTEYQTTGQEIRMVVFATVMQTIWDCSWSRAPYLPGGIVSSEHPASLWVCVRPTAKTVRRPVKEEECANCPHWQEVTEEEC